ncbi:TonB-dependent siderophore receptor [Malaciobacter marinus]|uniref:TonB-dependent siderophore receptor n=1 Tax=Malaciobacter marinus TaxID=505249 RepID=A0A347THX3_9BACT|nr:TonB-dependent receptor [Malaciobacter marinus]AXX86201.1 TonB-dependent siderophore receptor [Malaciobacter marinus]PHO16747.1 TonB-dependent siderophore receptor [Malaciobacter marinus]
MNKTISLILSSLICSSIAYAHSEHEKKSTNLNSITVTANKIEENIKDVPQSITVLDETTLQEKGIKTVIDVINQVPGMYAANSTSGTYINFRGLNTSLFTNNNPVVVYINGIPMANRYNFNPALANVQRVEVLRGPQGTLYGKDAIGAVINIVTKEANNYYNGSLTLEYGSNNYNLANFYINGPIIKDRLFWGLNGNFQKDDGWIKNTYPGMNDHANRQNSRKVNTYFLYKPTDRLSLKLNLTDEHEKKHWSNGYSQSDQIDVSDANRDDAEHFSFDVPTVEILDTQAQSFQAKYAFNNFDFSSLTTHKKFNIDGEYDADYSDNPAFKELYQMNKSETKSWTQEFRLSSTNSEDFRWVAGLYFEDEKLDNGPYGMQFNMMGTKMVQDAQSITNSKTQALFGQVTIPFYEDFELTLGGRYQRIKKDIDLDMYMLPVGVSGPAMNHFNDEKTWNTFLPKLALSYKINEDWTTYTSISKGYMPGGFNYFAMNDDKDANSFEAQKSTNYEIGLKGSFDKTDLTLSIFRMDIKDVHVYKSLSTSVWLTDNAKKAYSQGVELEISHYPNSNWELTSAFGFTDAKYKEYDAGDAKYDDEKIQLTPEYTARVGIGYFNPSGFYSRADINLQGPTYFFHDSKNKMDKQDNYITTNVKLGYKYKDWDFYAYANNIFDEKYVTAFDTAGGMSRITFGDPRKIGVGLRYSF